MNRDELRKVRYTLSKEANGTSRGYFHMWFPHSEITSRGVKRSIRGLVETEGGSMVEVLVGNLQFTNEERSCSLTNGNIDNLISQINRVMSKGKVHSFICKVSSMYEYGKLLSALQSAYNSQNYFTTVALISSTKVSLLDKIQNEIIIQLEDGTSSHLVVAVGDVDVSPVLISRCLVLNSLN